MAQSTLVKGGKSLKFVSIPEFNRKMLVQPAVIQSEHQMNIAIGLYEPDNPEEQVRAFAWGLLFPQNFIAYWRAMQILDVVETVGSADLSHAYYAALREQKGMEAEDAQMMIDRIGSQTHAQIMNRAIPEYIRELIIDRVVNNEAMAYWAITEEIAAGTLDWCEEFMRHGVRHPKRTEYGKDILKRYRKMIESYARKQEYKMDYPIMKDILNAILDAHEKGLDEELEADMVFALSVVVADQSTSSLLAAMFGGTQEEEDARLEDDINTILHWVNKTSPIPDKTSIFDWLFQPFKKTLPEVATPHEVQFALIKREFHLWGDYPVIKPIVPADS